MLIHGLVPSDTPAYPLHFDIESVIRPNILSLHPYRCARDDYQEGILLDANENSLGHTIPPSSSLLLVDTDKSCSSEIQKALANGAGASHPDNFHSLDLHRYPDPAQSEIKTRIAKLRGLVDGLRPRTECVFLGVGSDEVIDLLMRVCVVPARERIMITPPTYGMYTVCAQVNDLAIVKVPLNVEGGVFQLRLAEMKRVIDEDPSIKLIFLCSPGNPTGTLLRLSDIQELLEYPKFKGIVIVDEAYIDFSPPGSSTVSLVQKYANLCVMQTLSKSFGLAAIRLGIALAQPPLIQVLTNTKAPYNISTPTATLALSALSPSALPLMSSRVSTLNAQRATLLSALPSLAPLGLGAAIGGNHANFIMVPVLDRVTGLPDSVRSERIYKELAEKEGIVVRFRGREYGCAGCVRITVGSVEQNRIMLERLQEVLGRI